MLFSFNWREDIPCVRLSVDRSIASSRRRPALARYLRFHPKSRLRNLLQ